MTKKTDLQYGVATFRSLENDIVHNVQPTNFNFRTLKKEKKSILLPLPIEVVWITPNIFYLTPPKE
jgi:hypothetical protein